eukprot:TRINITY_DN34319_c0_g1_i1.p1 TRINITY_DN34319_c0_g1~~TRINITY_DN34319_c0_g1_i1.p1  ORF type:complete len:117 (+),score=20.82 TRINITY_DN34319_c0_g1_i1:293-643(+)
MEGGCGDLFAALAESPRCPLEALDVSHNRAGDRDATQLASLLVAPRPCVARINIAANSITETGVAAILQALNKLFSSPGGGEGLIEIIMPTMHLSPQVATQFHHLMSHQRLKFTNF